MAASNGNQAAARSDDDHSSQIGDFWTAPAYAPVSEASIQDYSLQAFLGEGSTAHVYLATRVDTHDLVAIKVIDKLLVRQAQMEHKVQREILLHSPLRHRHVVRVREAFEDARNHYIVLEYCEGGSVASRMRSLREQCTTMDEATVKTIFRQTAIGVAYLHARGIIHRDLKLSNLLLTDEGDIKISDFGLATLISDEHPTVCGTPNFIAPEVLRSTEAAPPYDETVDIWSLGCVLHTLLLGKPPFEGFKVSDTLANVSNAGRQPLHFPRGFSATIGDLIKRMLSRDAAARPTIAQVLAHPWLRASTPTNDQRQGSLPPYRLREIATESVARSRPSARQTEKTVPARRRSVSKKARKILPSAKGRLDYESDESSACSSGSYSGFDLHGAYQSAEKCSESDEESLVESDELFSSDVSAQTIAGDNTQPSVPQPVGDAHSERRASVKRDERKPSELPSSNRPRSVTHVEAAKTDPTEVHFLRLYVEVTDLPFLGIASDITSEITWDCWEASDIRQLTRFTLRMGDREYDYVPSKASIRSTSNNGPDFRHIFAPVTGTPSAAASDDNLGRLVRLCQCFATRSLQLRRAAMALDVENLPMVHFDRLPESILESLRRESVRTTLIHELGTTNSGSAGCDGNSARCVLPGIGIGEFDADGQLVIHFFSGPMLQMSASGSTIRYCRSPGEQEDEFDLARTPFLPTEVKKHFEHVPAFIRQLKAP